MTSTTSIISIFVLLLATYCHSAPIETEFQFSTVENELTSVKPKPIKVAIEFGTVPTTHAKRLAGQSIEQFTTERSIPEEHNSNKRTLLHEFTTVPSLTVHTVHKRSADESSKQFTTERSVPEEHNSNKRTLLHEFTTVPSLTVPTVHKRSDDQSSKQFTTERSVPQEHNSNKRTLLHEFTTVPSLTVPMVHERSADDSSEEFTTEHSHVDSKRGSDEVVGESISEVTNGDVVNKRTVEDQIPDDSGDDDKRSVGEWTTEKTELIDGKQKRTKEHIVSNELFVTEESSTDFNNRVVRLMEHEPVDLELTTIPESSSFETLAHTTGLLKQRHVPVPETEESKESDEKEFTTAESH